MYVSQLDRPWLETPFKIQGFVINNEADITEIDKYCKYVYIDESVMTSRSYEDDWGKSPKEQRIFTLPGGKRWQAECQSYDRVSSLTYDLLDNLVLGRTEAVESAKKVVSACIESIMANPYTMMLVSQMAEKGRGLEQHSLSSAVLAASFGRFLSIEGVHLESLALGALLHDVGMIRIEKELFNKKGKRNSFQYKRLQEHSVMGRTILMANEGLWSAVDVAYSHHERIDGNGYPRGLESGAIPLHARIVSIVDAYDVMVSSTSYQEKQLSPTEAISEIYKNRGSQFDDKLAKSFVRFLGLYPLGSLVQLGSGKVAIVVEKNPFYQKLPKVVIVLDSEGNRIDSQLVDLFQESGGTCDSNEYVIVKTLPNGHFGINVGKFLEKGVLEIS